MSQLNQSLNRPQQPTRLDSNEGESMLEQQQAELSAMNNSTANKVISTQQRFLQQIQQWRNQGVRIDVPGSPVVGQVDPKQPEQVEKQSSSVVEDPTFTAASHNTLAVAEALDRILKKTQTPNNSSEQVQTSAIQNEAPAVEAPVAPQPVSPPKAFQPRWEVPAFSWPTTVDQLLGRGLEGYEEVSQYIMQQAEGGKKVISIHSFASGEGCTTLALCLAKLFSKSDVKIALVDASLDNADLGQQLGVESQQGWESVSENYGCAPEEIAMLSKSENLTLIPLATSAIAVNHLDGLKQTIAELRGSYDLILIDGGRVRDESMPLDFIDGAIIVRDIRAGSDEQVTEVVRRLTASGTSIIGVTENFVE